MEYDLEKIDEIILALLWLTSFKKAEVYEPGTDKTGKRWIVFTKRTTSLIRRAKPNRLFRAEEGEKRSRIPSFLKPIGIGFYVGCRNCTLEPAVTIFYSITKLDHRMHSDCLLLDLLNSSNNRRFIF